MLEFLGAGENLAFVIALAIMLLIGVVEAVGLGSSALGHDIDLDGDSNWLGWLGIGTLPLLMLLVVFLASFGIVGLVGQQFALNHLGHLLPPMIALPAAGLAAIPATSGLSRLLARILPTDETTAINIDQLVGLPAQIVVGRATQGSPAKARVRDRHGQVHYVMAEPDTADASFAEGDEIRLVAREHHIFRAVATDRANLNNRIER